MDLFALLCRVTEIDDEDIDKFREILKKGHKNSSNKENEKQKGIIYCQLVKLSIT